MIRKILKKISLLSKKEQAQRTESAIGDAPIIIPRKSHSISRNQISGNALKVLYRLHKAGFKAYLVGGGVRDILLGLHPKDFDVATNAEPEQVRNLFSNCRLIGRRFRLAHVFFGREIVEVATFRASSVPSKEHAHSEHGMIMRDNVYGEMDEDAFRRDFTVNALYYNIADFSIVDYTGGLQDLENRTLKLIGRPDIRFREDPVRIIRAIRLSAKLDLKIDKALEKPIKQYHNLIGNVPPARLFEEILKMFHSGASEKVFSLLNDYELLTVLLPYTMDTMKNGKYPQEKLLKAVFDSTDGRIKQGKPVTPAFLFAAFLYYPMLSLTAKIRKEQSIPEFPAQMKAMDKILAQQSKIFTIPKRIAHTVREIWTLQIRLNRRHGRKAERLFQEQKFRAAYDFLLMRSQAGEKVDDLANWWTDYNEANAGKRRAMVKALNKTTKNKKTNAKPLNEDLAE